MIFCDAINNNDTRLNKLLTDILGGIDYTAGPAVQGLVIDSITADSRRVEPGALFVCVRGLSVDGHDFAEAAAHKGAAAIIADRERMAMMPQGFTVPVIWVSDTRRVMGDIASAFYDHPAAGLTLIGLTGTNGKTTTSFILEAIIRAAGYQPGVIGTINYRYGGGQVPASFTTPEPLELQRLLREMADHGVTHVIMEVSSHALAMYRVQGLMFDAALFTNLTRDHLDFHPDMEAYYQAKKRLFSDYLSARGAAVIMIEDEPAVLWGRRLHGEITALRQGGEAATLSCGMGAALDVHVQDCSFSTAATTATIIVEGRPLAISTNLVGAFNLKNILGAVGVAVGLGLEAEAIISGLRAPIMVPGRLEAVVVDDSHGQSAPIVFVDYAHTPDALHNVLYTLRQLNPRRLIAVFGCGGDRDPGKRQMMGKIAGELADVAIITADNSRSESTEAIMAEIEKGVVSAGKKGIAASNRSATGYLAISARGEAIATAIDLAQGEDIVLISGKGHETYQISAQGSVFFDDRLEAAKCLRQKGPRTM